MADLPKKSIAHTALIKPKQEVIEDLIVPKKEITEDIVPKKEVIEDFNVLQPEITEEFMVPKEETITIEHIVPKKEISEDSIVHEEEILVELEPWENQCEDNRIYVIVPKKEPQSNSSQYLECWNEQNEVNMLVPNVIELPLCAKAEEIVSVDYSVSEERKAKAAQKMRLYRQRLKERKMAAESNDGTTPPLLRKRALTSTERSRLCRIRKNKKQAGEKPLESSVVQDNGFVILNDSSSTSSDNVKKMGKKNANAAQNMRLYRQRLREKTKIADESNSILCSPALIRQRALTSTERSRLAYQRKKLAEMNLLHSHQQSIESQNSQNSESKQNHSLPNNADTDLADSLLSKECSERRLQCDEDTKKKGPLNCHLCEKQFRYKSGLDLHMRTHTGEKPYSCNQCPATFTQKNTLTRHMKSHTGVNQYTCDICHAKFAEKSTLNNHTRTHTGEKPFSCEMCHAKFSQRSTLNSHVRIHTRENLYSCNVCQAKFTQKSTLNNHMRTHTGEKTLFL